MMKTRNWLLFAAGVLILDFMVAKRRSAETAGYNVFRETSGDLSASGFLGIRYPFV